MSSNKPANKYAGAPGAVKPAQDQVFDLFRTFRHNPPPAPRREARHVGVPVKDKPEK